MSTTSTTGTRNRRKGHQAEKDVARYLRGRGYPDACTTRSKLGHDGAHAPGDVVGPVGLVIEVKNVARSGWPAWARQAEVEACGRPWVVVRKLVGCTDVGLWPSLSDRHGVVWNAAGGRNGLIIPFGEYLDWWEDDA